MERQLISSGSPYEHHIGLSRAVRVGPMIAVAGNEPLGHLVSNPHPREL
jgi:hypothetical protein